MSNFSLFKQQKQLQADSVEIGKDLLKFYYFEYSMIGHESKTICDILGA